MSVFLPHTLPYSVFIPLLLAGQHWVLLCGGESKDHPYHHYSYAVPGPSAFRPNPMFTLPLWDAFPGLHCVSVPYQKTQDWLQSNTMEELIFLPIASNIKPLITHSYSTKLVKKKHLRVMILRSTLGLLYMPYQPCIAHTRHFILQNIIQEKKTLSSFKCIMTKNVRLTYHLRNHFYG